MDTEETGRFHQPGVEDVHSNTSTYRWYLCGRSLPKGEIVFFRQVILIYVVVITCIVNLALNNNKTHLWTSLLCGSLGYLLPNPTLPASQNSKKAKSPIAIDT